MRRLLTWTVLVVGCVLLVLSVPAAYVNRTILDAPTFAANVDELRQRPDVSEVLGREVSARLTAANPDLVAIAPLVDQIAIGVMGSDALSGPVQLASSQFLRALTTEDSEQVILRVADVGAVVAGVVGAVAPERAPRAAEVSVTLAEIGDQAFAEASIRYAGIVDTLAWLLPVLAVAFLAGSVFIDRDRWAAIRRVGWAIVVSVAALALVVAVGSVVVRSLASSERADVLLDGVWDIFVRPIWWAMGMIVGIAAVLVLLGSRRAADWDPAGVGRRIIATPTTTGGAVARSLALLTVGVVAVIDPLGVLTVASFVVGAVLAVTAAGRLVRLAAHAFGDRRSAERRSWGPVLVGGLVVVSALAAMIVWAARPTEPDVAGAAGDAVTGEGNVCNGHAELCDRTFDEVSYAASHNSMSVAFKPGWFLGEQGLDIVASLDSGVRALLIDVWYGHAAEAGKVRTSARSYEEALAVANEELGPEVVAAALRVIDSVAPGEPQGPEELFMCHGLCETGATPFDDTLVDIRAWLATNPDEVMTIFVEDHVDAADIAVAVLDAGLEDYLYTPVQGEPFPTLGEMIRSGQRLVVMVETRDGRPEYPWLVNGFDFVQETPYDFPTVESFSCAPNRGRPDAPLLQINHWLSGFTELVTQAQLVNAADVLGTRVEQCRDERGLQPTFVAVNYADIGDLMTVVDQLNGVD